MATMGGWLAVVVAAGVVVGSEALVESGSVVMTKLQPWQQLSRFSFSGGEEGAVMGTVSRLDGDTTGAYLCV